MRLAWALLLLLLLSGCTPLQYVRANPVEPPAPIRAPPLSEPTVSSNDCGRFQLEGEWRSLPWGPGGLDTIEVGDIHPGVKDGLTICRHVVIAPGFWVQAREARDRYPLAREQLQAWRQYAERQAIARQEESEALAELVEIARRRQVEAFFIGTGVGAGATVIAVLAIVFGTR